MFPCFIIIYIKFLSTLSLRRATRCSSVSPNRSGFLSTLSLRRATRAERYANSQQEFLSTLSLRRATDTSKDTIKTVTNFYPRSPCGERQAANGLADAPPKISIHALLAESDSRSAAGPAGSRHFYPRSPCGERLAGAISQLQRRTDFYPRSPCGERRLRLAMIPFFLYFYPRSPCGERHILSIRIIGFSGFLSTLSLRRATGALLSSINPQPISIHALLAESDFRHCTTYLNCSRFLSTLSLRRATHHGRVNLLRFKHFYPRSPCGERRRRSVKLFRQNYISIHALLAESDRGMQSAAF